MTISKPQELTFTALGNPVRRHILHMLSQKDMSVVEIAAQVTVSRPAISKHLKLLKNAQLIKFQTVGTCNFYGLNKEGFDNARCWLDGFWDNALDRFKLLAENTGSQLDGDVK